jgi:hypothetical protein
LGSEAAEKVQLPVGAILVSLMTFLFAFLEMAPEWLPTFSGRFPAMVQGNIPEALALMVCTLLVLSGLILVIRGDGRGIRYHLAGSMLTVFVGTVISLVGISWTVVEVAKGAPLTVEMFLGSGTMAGALLALVALGTVRRTLLRMDTKGSGDGS